MFIRVNESLNTQDNWQLLVKLVPLHAGNALLVTVLHTVSGVQFIRERKIMVGSHDGACLFNMILVWVTILSSSVKDSLYLLKHL